MIPVRFESIVDSIDVGEWLSVDLEDAPEDPDAEGATAVYVVRIGDVQFRIKAPYLGEGPIEVLSATRVSGEPRTKWPDLKNLRPQVVRMRRRRGQTDDDDHDRGGSGRGSDPNTDDPEEPESA